LIVLDRKARRELEHLLADGNTAQKIAKRARIVVMTANGHGVTPLREKRCDRSIRLVWSFLN
jgi:hypothetical protein